MYHLGKLKNTAEKIVRCTRCLYQDMPFPSWRQVRSQFQPAQEEGRSEEWSAWSPAGCCLQVQPMTTLEWSPLHDHPGVPRDRKASQEETNAKPQEPSPEDRRLSAVHIPGDRARSFPLARLPSPATLPAGPSLGPVLRALRSALQHVLYGKLWPLL